MTGVKEREPDAEGLTAEIAALRERLHAAMEDQNADLRTLAQGANALTRMVATQHRLSPRKTRDLATNMAAVLRDVADIMRLPDA